MEIRNNKASYRSGSFSAICYTSRNFEKKSNSYKDLKYAWIMVNCSNGNKRGLMYYCSKSTKFFQKIEIT